MRFSTLTTALTSLSLASGRLIGIAAPSTLAPNSTFTLTLLSEGYIQSVADVAVAWGFSLAPGYPGTLGSFAQSAYLGPEKSNQGQENVTITATVPAGLAMDAYQGKDILLNAGIYSLYGASGGATVTGFNVTVRVGESTGGEVVESEGQGWIQNTVA
ncbi:hypothetical protein J4E83_001258 [Alternaria metachromatica]|uniref:uncharacterized protein n=1 Tax=Alternaria metachromatica TaxID=283354 RepID=UPI0020C2E764|nr:uncharacterized protein J4E83_001258 [Alternaria metachromatica]KAI4636304.1 hypothetical protein J4E83_001258 [Alternaria metachromatica]